MIQPLFTAHTLTCTLSLSRPKHFSAPTHTARKPTSYSRASVHTKAAIAKSCCADRLPTGPPTGGQQRNQVKQPTCLAAPGARRTHQGRHQRLDRLGWPADTTATRLRRAGLACAASLAAAAAPWLYCSGGMTVPASLITAGRVRLLFARARQARQVRVSRYGTHPLFVPRFAGHGKAATAVQRRDVDAGALACGGRSTVTQAGGWSRASVWCGAQPQQALRSRLTRSRLHMALVTADPMSSWQGTGTPSHARSAHRKAASVLKSRPSGWRRLRS